MEPSPLFDDLRLTTAGLFFGLFPPKRLRRLTADLRTLRDAVHPSAITDGVTPRSGRSGRAAAARFRSWLMYALTDI